MKKLNLIIVLVLVSFFNAYSYEFTGAKWPGLNPVVKYYLNEQGCEDVPDEWDILHRSFEVWDEVPSAVIETEYAGMTAESNIAKDGKNIVKWADKDEWPLGPRVIGACYTWRQGTILEEFDIVFNSQNYTWGVNGEEGRMDIGHIATHEVGHALGLDHSKVSGAVMWPTAKMNDTTNRALDSDDSLGLTILYPRTGTNNHAPIITSKAITEAVAGVRYTYDVEAYDPDGDSLIYRLHEYPLNMRIDSLTGVITWFPKFLDLGSHSVTVTVTDVMGKSAHQIYTINVSNLVVYTNNDTIGFMDTMYHNVYVSPMDEYGVFAGNIELQYDSDQMVVLDIDTVGSILKGVSFVENIDHDTIKVAFAGSEAFSGEGVLFRIKLLIYPEWCGTALEMPITKAFFNDGDPEATTSSGTVFMHCGDGFTLDGKLLYLGNNVGVGGADVEILQTKQTTKTTEDGYWAFLAPRSKEAYTISFAKDSGDIRDAVSAYDASLILRYVVDLHPLKTYPLQDATADVNTNHMITAYDAALILRFIIGYNDATSIGKWVMVPQDTTVPDHLEPNHNNNVYCYMIGDVSGNWKQYEKERRADSPAGTVSLMEYEGADEITEEDTIVIYKTSISVNEAFEDVYAGEFEINYDSSKFELFDVKPSVLLNGFLSESNAINGKIKIVFAGIEPLEDTGTLFDIRLKSKETIIDEIPSSEMTYCRLNESSDQAVSINENVKNIYAPLALSTGMKSIYPNPFKGLINIEYAIKSSEHVKLAVYNLQGREVVTLINGTKQSGLHRVQWDGKNMSGQELSAQVYLLRFITSSKSKTVKLFKVR